MDKEPNRARVWPALPTASWDPTMATLHLWTQIVGKIRLARTPWLNHSWHVTLYVTSRGLSTSPIPHDARSFQIDFDFIEQQLAVRVSDGRASSFPLEPQSVATFYARVMDALRQLDVPVTIHSTPNELPNPVRFDADTAPREYNGEHARLFWQALVEADRVFTLFRARFVGKCSPVHFFWGAADLAVTRFSGRAAPQHPGGIPHLPDRVTREAYSHEVSSAGFWPGGGGVPPVFYSYAYPEPAGFAAASVRPSGAAYNPTLREFILPYDVVRESASPDETLLDFLQSTYEAAADLGGWDRPSLERSEPWPYRP